MCLSSFVNAQKLDTKYTIKEFDRVPLETILKQLAKDNDFELFYKKEWLSEYSLTTKASSFNVNKLFEYLLKDTELDYYISDADNIYILPKETFISNLKFGSANEREPVVDIQENNSNKYLKGSSTNSQKTFAIGRKKLYQSGENVRVNGIVTDMETDEKLVGVTVYVIELSKGTVTDGSGFFFLDLKPGTYTVVFQSLGMEELETTFKVNSSGSIEVQLQSESMSIGEVVVNTESTKRGSQSGMESIGFMKMKEIPALLGEKDVIKIAQMLPGIVSVGEGSGGINVRGGNADQNLFYLNNLPIYNSSHLFGFFSSINSNIVDKFNIYKGFVPVNFGGRLSSVFEVQTRAGNKEKFYSEGNVSPISASLVVETPIIENKSSLLLSGRSSYSNWILRRLEDPDLRNSSASFYDFTINYDHQINDHSSISFLGYNSNDEFNLNALINYKYGNKGAVVNYTDRLSPKIKSNTYLIYSNYNFYTNDQSSISDAYEHNYSIDHSEFKFELDYQMAPNHSVKGGINSILYQLDRGTVRPFGEESVLKETALGKEKALESAIFVTDKVDIGSRLDLNLGARYSLYNELGPKHVRTYNAGRELSDFSVVDTLSYANWNNISTYSGPEFRIGLDYILNGNSTLKLAYSQMRQYLFMLSNTISIAPTDQWKLADSHLKPQESKLVSIGYYFDLQEKEIQFSAEVYKKWANNLVEYKDGADFLATSFVETSLLQGGLNAYGAEFMLSKDSGKLNGWISYAYSRSIMQIEGENEWESINRGLPYASNFDKPHVLNMVMNYKMTRRFSFSSNMVYSTGRPITLPIGYYTVEDNPFIDYSARNEYRIPDYIRVDLSLKLEGNLKKHKKVHSYWMFSVYNALGRNNANSVFFNSESGIIQGYQYAVIGVPIYTLSWNWKLGNYEN